MVQEPKRKGEFLYNRAIFIWHNNYEQDLKVHWGMKLDKSKGKMDSYGEVRSKGKTMFRIRPKNENEWINY